MAKIGHEFRRAAGTARLLVAGGRKKTGRFLGMHPPRKSLGAVQAPSESVQAAQPTPPLHPPVCPARPAPPLPGRILSSAAGGPAYEVRQAGQGQAGGRSEVGFDRGQAAATDRCQQSEADSHPQGANHRTPCTCWHCTRCNAAPAAASHPVCLCNHALQLLHLGPLLRHRRLLLRHLAHHAVDLPPQRLAILLSLHRGGCKRVLSGSSQRAHGQLGCPRSPSLAVVCREQCAVCSVQFVVGCAGKRQRLPCCLSPHPAPAGRTHRRPAQPHLSNHAALGTPTHLGVIVLLPLQAAVPRRHLPLELVDLVVDHRQPAPQLADLVLQGGEQVCGCWRVLVCV